MKKIIFGFVLAFALSAFSWAEDLHMKNVSTNQPAADAQLTHQKDDNGNVKLKVHFYHLAKPDSLTPAKEAYVVWIEPNGQPPQNMGTIKVNDKVLFSPEDRYEVDVQGEDYIILRERDIHAVASERNDDGSGLYL